MIKELFFKRDNLIVLILLSFPLFHFWGEVRMFMKPVFLFVIGLICLFFFSKVKLLFLNFFTSLVIQLFILLLFSQFYFKWDVEIIPYLFLLALFMFYKIVRMLLLANQNSNENGFIIRAYIVIISIEILLFIVSKENAFLQFFPNESIFSILIAAQLLFVTPYLKKYNENFVKNKERAKIIFIGYLFLCYCFLFYTKGRAGILGFTVALCILNYNYLKSKVGYFKGIIIVFSLLVVLVKVKSNSSSGRLLIYKVVITQLEPKKLVTESLR